MHPAPSVIAFTTCSGIGFGLLAFLGLGWPAAIHGQAFALYFVAYVFAVGGLLASTLHLANPKNAIHAFSQWRTSWLSREAILAIAALCCSGLYAVGAIFSGQHWQPVGWAGSALSLATVGSTAMIYTQLKTVPRWNSPLTLVLFLMLALAGGALLAGQREAAIVLLLVTGAVQVATWFAGDKSLVRREHSTATATRLSGKAVRHFEGPHTGRNYLLNEMGYQLARRHGVRLRCAAVLSGFVVPAVILALASGLAATIMAAAFHLAGTLVARWLFFAEAEHVVGLYYGYHNPAVSGGTMPS